MNIDEAKRIIGNIKRCDIPKQELDKWQALDLGIEALKLVQSIYSNAPNLPHRLLPGETE